MDISKTVQEYYDNMAEQEWQRLERHKIEYEVTRRYLDKFVPEASRILDVGGGPGRYSIYLATQGHQVTLFDLSERNLDLAKIKANESKTELDDYVHGNALDLDKLMKQSFDVVLCMGPLYHLTEFIQRHSVIDNCLKLLKPGGILFVAFISAYAPILSTIEKSPETIVTEKEILLHYLLDGTNIESVENPGFTDAWFENPSNIEGFMAVHPVEQLALLAAEGMLSLNEDTINSLSQEAFDAYIDLSMKLSTNPMTWSTCEHMLYIGRKKGSDAGSPAPGF